MWTQPSVSLCAKENSTLDSNASSVVNSLKVCIDLRAMGRELPYGITQCHLPPNRSKCSALTQARQVGTWFIYHGGTEGWVDLGGWLHTEIVYLSADRCHLKPQTHDKQMLANTCLPTMLANKSLSCVQKVGQHFMLANNVCCLRTCSFFVGQQAANRVPWLVGCSKHYDSRMDGCILRWLH